MAINKQTAEVLLKINSKEAEDKIDKLERKAKKLHEDFTKAFDAGDDKAVRRITRELDRTNRELQAARTNAANIRSAMTRLDQASPKELKRTITLINKELNSGRVKRGSQEWYAYIEALKAAKSELRKIEAEMSVTTEKTKTLGERIKGWQTAIIGAIMGIFALVSNLKGKIQEYVDAFTSIESEMANVRKYTGMTEAQVNELNEAFANMDTRTTAEGLNQLAQEAGRLGKQSVEDVLGFARAADQINVALDDLGEGATLTLSKLTSIFGDEERLGTERSLLAVGSVINELSQNCAASAPYIAEFAARLGGVAAQSGMTSQQVMSFAAVLDAAGVNVEASSTALQQFIVRLYQDPAKYAKAAGMDVKKFSDLVKTDINAAVMQLLETVNKMGSMSQLAPMFADMGEKGSNSIKVLSILSGKIDELRGQQEVANQAFEEATSITNEFNVQNNTAAAQLDKAKNRAHMMAAELGKQLYPIMMYCVDATTMLMRATMTMISFVVQHRTAVVSITAAVAAYTLVVQASNIALATHKAWTIACSVATKAWTGLKLLAAAAVAFFSGNVTRANAAMVMFNRTLKISPVGMVTAAVAALVTGIIALTARSRLAASAQKQLADAEKEAARNASAQMAETKALYDKTQDLSAAMEERLKAANKLKEMHPDYFSKLSAEAIVAGNAADEYQRMAENIMAIAKAQAYKGKIDALANKMADAEMYMGSDIDKLRNMSKLPPRVKEIIDSDMDERQMAEALAEWAKAAGPKTKASAATYATPGAMAAAATDNAVYDMISAHISGYIAEIEVYEDAISQLESRILKLSSTTKTKTPPKTPTGTSDYNPTDSGSGKGKKVDPIKEALDAEKAIIDREMALNAINYATSLKDYEAYIDQKKTLQMGLIDNQLLALEALNAAESKEYADLLLEKMELQKQWDADTRAKSLADLEAQYQEQKNLIIDMYLDANSEAYMDDRKLKQLQFEAEVEFMQKKLALYAEGDKERAKLQQQLDDKLRDDQITKQKQTADALAKFEQQYRAASGSERQKQEMAILDSLYDQGLISETEYQKARRAIIEKYRNEDYDRASKVKSQYTDLVKNISDSFSKLFESISEGGQDFWNNLSDAATASAAVIGAAISQVSALANAQRDLELAKIEKRYDAEIKAAGKNQKKVAAIEDQKSAEIARTKKKYNDRAMRMEIAQAIAQTAQAAIAAYASAAAIPLTGWIMAPIAASLATAAGAVQIAVIKKQHETEAMGYYDGGFTDKSADDRKEVGVVHANEFVANSKALRNPAVMPVLRIIDHAQRTNTVASLTSADIAAATGQGSTPHGGSTQTIINNVIDVDPLNRLSNILDRGIRSTVTMTGEDGIVRQTEKYNKLNSNPRR